MDLNFELTDYEIMKISIFVTIANYSWEQHYT